MLRDPEDILTSNGRKYELNEENLKPLKEYLGEDYKLPDKLLLQVITHKSFAHGTKPYNERLSFLGEELLKLSASKFVLGKKQVTSGYKFSVGDLNFDSLGSLTHRLIVTDRVLSEFASAKGIDKVFFCKVALPQQSSSVTETKNYKPKAMYSTITSSLVGAVALQHGKSTAERFIQENLLTDILPMVQKVRGGK
ncbi:DEKNAAC103473 [Brettanomyces naardenensis]|uniref:DEKNAAC103473 n=1 Tax=Brettanomyces naardenensis TaxID=13370 RepID=A0A448YNG2_BRENA|nr:DEKNAAC103473 [Brettanomyces naardenensis]